jgi:hypothetical protein
MISLAVCSKTCRTPHEQCTVENDGWPRPHSDHASDGRGVEEKPRNYRVVHKDTGNKANRWRVCVGVSLQPTTHADGDERRPSDSSDHQRFGRREPCTQEELRHQRRHNQEDETSPEFESSRDDQERLRARDHGQPRRANGRSPAPVRVTIPPSAKDTRAQEAARVGSMCRLGCILRSRPKTGTGRTESH